MKGFNRKEKKKKKNGNSWKKGNTTTTSNITIIQKLCRVYDVQISVPKIMTNTIIHNTEGKKKFSHFPSIAVRSAFQMRGMPQKVPLIVNVFVHVKNYTKSKNKKEKGKEGGRRRK